MRFVGPAIEPARRLRRRSTIVGSWVRSRGKYVLIWTGAYFDFRDVGANKLNARDILT
jgi:hypothetical protein